MKEGSQLRCWAAASKSVWLTNEKKLAVLGALRFVGDEESKASAEAGLGSVGHICHHVMVWEECSLPICLQCRKCCTVAASLTGLCGDNRLRIVSGAETWKVWCICHSCE